MPDSSSELRKRKNAPKSGASERKQKSKKEEFVEYNQTTFADLLSLGRLLFYGVFLAAAIWFGYWFASYMTMLHENQLWFSNIREVEREISFRTEAGLYYSYYKQIVNHPSHSLRLALSDLTRDNLTEHGRTINILQRFNIYQEVGLAVLYKYLVMQFHLLQMRPIFFYTYSCFSITGFYAASLTLFAWYITRNPCAGVLMAAYITSNLDHITRVFFTVNLRETFAVPFLLLQIWAACVYLKPNIGAGCSKAVAGAFFVFSTLFALMWQFNQFIFLLQAFSLFAVAVLDLVPAHRVVSLLTLQALSLLTVWLCQFCQRMLLGAMVLSFIPAAILTLVLLPPKIRGNPGLLKGAARFLVQLCLTATLTFGLNTLCKLLLHIDADTHILSFVKAKLGFSSPVDFESRIYLCHGAFVFLNKEFYWEGVERLTLIPYVVAVLLILALVALHLFRSWRSGVIDEQTFAVQRPHLIYLVVQSVLIGIVAMLTLRIKYLWFPHIILLAAFLLCDLQLLPSLVQRWGEKAKVVVKALVFVIPLLTSLFIMRNFRGTYEKQQTDLKEFWDPDTVQLMEWISQHTRAEESFTGSMQLLAGVKLCTGRPLTNHPHFEDKWLRDRTKRLYQIYGRVEPAEVHGILSAEGTDYIILEDSICLAPSDGCRTPDLIDLNNGHRPDHETVFDDERKTKNKPLPPPRFCDQIRQADNSRYTRYFRLVMENKTFRVYKVLHVDQVKSPKQQQQYH